MTCATDRYLFHNRRHERALDWEDHWRGLAYDADAEGDWARRDQLHRLADAARDRADRHYDALLAIIATNQR